MKQHTLPSELCTRLTEDSIIVKNLMSVIWFGSIRNNQDVHYRSDYDIQIVLSKPSPRLIMRLNKILVDYPSVDLSIMYMHDIRDKNGKIIFHDGTKGLFFMYVLAAGKILYGTNIYAPIINSLALEDVKPSLLITIREYLSRLRVMAAQSPNDTLQFKRYSLKLFKDVLLYIGDIPLTGMTKLDNARTSERITVLYSFSNLSKESLKSITDYEHNLTNKELSALLNDYEQLIQMVCNDEF